MIPKLAGLLWVCPEGYNTRWAWPDLCPQVGGGLGCLNVCSLTQPPTLPIIRTLWLVLKMNENKLLKGNAQPLSLLSFLPSTPPLALGYSLSSLAQMTFGQPVHYLGDCHVHFRMHRFISGYSSQMLGTSPDNAQVLWLLNCTFEDHCLKDRRGILFRDYRKEKDMSPISPTEEQKYEVSWESQRRGLWDPHGSGITKDHFSSVME